MTRDEYGAAYQKGYRLTVRFLISRGSTWDDAEETAQAAWTRGWERLGQLRDTTMVLTWVNSIALNLRRAILRRKPEPLHALPEIQAQPRINLAAIDVTRILRYSKKKDRLVLESQLEGYNAHEIAFQHGWTEMAGRTDFSARAGRRENASVESSVSEALYWGRMPQSLRDRQRASPYLSSVCLQWCEGAQSDAMTQTVIPIAAVLAAMVTTALPVSVEPDHNLETYLRQNIGLSQDEFSAIRSGQPVAKTLPPRTPAEVFLFGAVYIHATPETYVRLTRDVERLRELPDYLALGVFAVPPQLSHLKGFSFDNDDIEALRKCRPGDCQIQMPATSIEEFHRSINWSAPDVNEQLNQFLQKTALQRLLAYQRDGNEALGVYNDKHDPIEVQRQFAFMLSYDSALPEHLPDFYHYLLAYPRARPASVEDTFYWSKVKFGLKPTLRVVQVVIMRGKPTSPIAFAVAEKQLYASHYFETALDLSYCVLGGGDPQRPGFYLIKVLGSEQAGLTGFKGSIIRKTAVGRSVSNLRDALTTIRNTLEGRN